MRRSALLPLLLLLAILPGAQRPAPDPSALERDLTLTVAGGAKTLTLDEAMAQLPVPAVSLALIENGRIAFARAYGGATPDTLFQAASLSKFVAAVGAMRLVERGTLILDADVNARAHLLARSGQCVRPRSPGHFARAAQHDRRHRRAGLSRLRGGRAAADAHARSSMARRPPIRRR